MHGTRIIRKERHQSFHTKLKLALIAPKNCASSNKIIGSTMINVTSINTPGITNSIIPKDPKPI